MSRLPRNTILIGDALTRLRDLPAGSADCVVTSPPYVLLRDYGAEGQIGAEPTVAEYVDAIVAVCDEILRVLKPSASFWLNLGDSYSRHNRFGAPPKGMLLAPERVLVALAERGWIVRNKVVWAKPNPMPTSVRDRLSCTFEPVYHLVRERRYFYDLDAIRVPHKSRPRGLTGHGRRETSSKGARPLKYESVDRTWAGPLASGKQDGLQRARREGRAGHRLGKNPGDVWNVATASYRGAHFATFPVALVTRPIKATCPARTCTTCGRPWQQAQLVPTGPDCGCNAAWQPGLVLDPFMGAGTTALAATQVGRDWLGIELNPTYADLATQRSATAVQMAPTAAPTPEGANHGAP